MHFRNAYPASCGSPAANSFRYGIARTITKALGVILMSLTSVAMSQAANITYGVNLPVGPGGVTGFVTTDGTLGTIQNANLVDWSLLLKDGSTTFTLTGPLSGNNSAQNNFGLTATATTLSVSLTSGWRLQNPCVTCGGPWLYFNSGGTPDIWLSAGGAQINVTPASGTYVVGTVAAPTAVPEPSSVALAALGFAAVLWKKRTQRPSAMGS